MNETAERVIDPRLSPTYPQRVHLLERPRLQALLKTWDDRIASAGQKLATVPAGSDRSTLAFLHIQMVGSRDQIAESVRRLPMEVDSLYEEDRLRLEEAVAALERLFRKWDEKAR